MPSEEQAITIDGQIFRSREQKVSADILREWPRISIAKIKISRIVIRGRRDGQLRRGRCP